MVEIVVSSYKSVAKVKFSSIYKLRGGFLCFMTTISRDGISPSAAAEKAGLAPGHVYKWKRGAKPSDVTVCKLMNANKWSKDELLGGKEKATALGGDLSAAREALIAKVYTLTDEQCEAWLRLLD